MKFFSRHEIDANQKELSREQFEALRTLFGLDIAIQLVAGSAVAELRVADSWGTIIFQPYEAAAAAARERAFQSAGEIIDTMSRTVGEQAELDSDNPTYQAKMDAWLRANYEAGHHEFHNACRRSIKRELIAACARLGCKRKTFRNIDAVADELASRLHAAGARRSADQVPSGK